MISVSERDFIDIYSPKSNSEVKFCWVYDEEKLSHVVICKNQMVDMKANSLCFDDEEEEDIKDADTINNECLSPSCESAVSADVLTICTNVSNFVCKELNETINLSSSSSSLAGKRKKDCSLFSRFYWDIILQEKFSPSTAPSLNNPQETTPLLVTLLTIIRIIGILFSEAQVIYSL